MMLSAGIKLGRYKIRSQLGAAGMGEMYLARDSGIELTVEPSTFPSLTIIRMSFNASIDESGLSPCYVRKVFSGQDRILRRV